MGKRQSPSVRAYTVTVTCFCHLKHCYAVSMQPNRTQEQYRQLDCSAICICMASQVSLPWSPDDATLSWSPDDATLPWSPDDATGHCPTTSAYSSIYVLPANYADVPDLTNLSFSEQNFVLTYTFFNEWYQCGLSYPSKGGDDGDVMIVILVLFIYVQRPTARTHKYNRHKHRIQHKA
jgi:hypothetical protein